MDIKEDTIVKDRIMETLEKLENNTQEVVMDSNIVTHFDIPPEEYCFGAFEWISKK